jgi:hypothetical protein
MSLGLGTLVSAVTDPGKIVKEVVDAVLPEQLDVVADLAGAAASYSSGRPLQAVGHLAQAMRDLPQAFDQPGVAARPAGGGWRPRGSAAFEPSAPPSRGSEAGGFTLDKLLSLLQQILDALGGKKTSGTTGSSPASKDSKTSDADDDSSSSKKASSSSSSSTSKTSSSSSKDDTALDKLNKLSDAEFMAKIRKGDLPKEITDDPKAMLAIEQRINHISEMTKMMSQMMQALHDMQMAILQNVRV